MISFADVIFFLNRSSAFWQSYLDVLSLPYEIFIYEELQHDPSPFLRAISGHLRLEIPAAVESDFHIQRDSKTEEWAARFRDEIRQRDILAHSLPRGPSRNLKNIRRFFLKEPMLPLPFSI